jgi:hypothetical protein
MKSNFYSLADFILEDDQIKSYYSSQSYLELRFLHQQEIPNFLYSHETARIGNSSLSYWPHEQLEEKLEEIIFMIQNHPLMKSDDDQCPLKGMMRICISYFLGLIETELYPGIINKL